MKAVGVIVEYNPFHNGHLYHLQQTKKITNSDVIIAIMSGNFLQRGEPALVSKWSRTKMALANGVDLVIELPFAYAAQKAETFAFGAVSLLDSLFVSEICFGSESGNIEEFKKTVHFLSQHEKIVDTYIKQNMQKGYSYPKAASLAYQSIQQDSCIDLSQPNNILGFHYLKAVKQLNSNMHVRTIKRSSANYHDLDFASDTIASATSIRKTLKEKNLQSIQKVIPYKTAIELKHYQKTYKNFSDWEQYFPYLKYQITNMSEEQLRNIYGVTEGIESRLKKYIHESESFQQFMENVKTKRYTWTRLQRLLLYILTNATDADMKQAHEQKTVPYIRLLGMNEVGQKYLHHIKHQVKIPIVSKPTSYSHPLLDLDLKVSQIYRLIYPVAKQNEPYLNDYKTPPILFEQTMLKVQE